MHWIELWSDVLCFTTFHSVISVCSYFLLCWTVYLSFLLWNANYPIDKISFYAFIVGIIKFFGICIPVVAVAVTPHAEHSGGHPVYAVVHWPNAFHGVRGLGSTPCWTLRGTPGICGCVLTKCIPWGERVGCVTVFVFNTPSPPPPHHIIGDPHAVFWGSISIFWRVDAVTQAAYYGWEKSAHKYAAHNNILMKLLCSSGNLIHAPAPPLVTASVADSSVHAWIRVSSEYRTAVMACVREHLMASSWGSPGVMRGTVVLVWRLLCSPFHRWGGSAGLSGNVACGKSPLCSLASLLLSWMKLLRLRWFFVSPFILSFMGWFWRTLEFLRLDHDSGISHLTEGLDSSSCLHSLDWWGSHGASDDPEIGQWHIQINILIDLLTDWPCCWAILEWWSWELGFGHSPVLAG